jgi:pimeloyl-ACP methyl ester carboxylesterase
LFVVQGAFGNTGGRFLPLEEMLEVSLVVANTPGFFCPSLTETSIPAFARAMDEVVHQSLSGRPVYVCGESVGGLIALAMVTDCAGRLVLDPPLRPAKCWPILPGFEERLAANPSLAPFMHEVFGMGAREERDYTPLLRGPRAEVLVGELPLYPERESRLTPSLVDEPERDMIRAADHLRLMIAPGAGHVIPGNAPGAFLSAVGRLLHDRRSDEQDEDAPPRPVARHTR